MHLCYGSRVPKLFHRPGLALKHYHFKYGLNHSRLQLKYVGQRLREVLARRKHWAPWGFLATQR